MQKLKLDKLKVKSFQTSSPVDNPNTIKGGTIIQTVNCPILSVAVVCHLTIQGCGSVIDGCHSALGCTIAGCTETITGPGTTIINPI